MPSFAVIIIAARLAERRRKEKLIQLRRTIRDSSDPWALPEKTFIALFRLNKSLARDLVQILQEDLQGRRVTAMSPTLQVLAALRFLGEGSYQRGVGQDFLIGMAQPTISKAIKRVASAIVQRMSHHVAFPTTAQERQKLSAEFEPEAGFPGVLGCVAGTFIAIFTPREDEESFVNPQGIHSLNVQIVSSYNLKILDVVANHPGSVNDQFIFNVSTVKREMERLYNDNLGPFFLLGDSGYKAEPFLLNPLPHAPRNASEKRYTEAHTSARSCIGRLFGVLKGRFRCLRRKRGLHYEPKKASTIVLACAILHNFMEDAGMERPDDCSHEDPTTNACSDEPGQTEGLRQRERILRTYFRA